MPGAHASDVQLAKGLTSLPKTNRAAVYTKVGEVATEVRELSVPEPGPGQVLVKITHSGVCHSDLHVMLGDWSFVRGDDGGVGGHEGVGNVVAAGAGVDPSLLGKRVGIKWLATTCMSCKQCWHDRDCMCAGAKISGAGGAIGTPGTFQEYTLSDAKYVTPIPDGLDSELAAPLLCGGVTVYKALKILKLEAGSWVAIPGAGGGLGHLGIQYAKAMGYRVIAIDGGDDKKKLCESLGADVFVDFMKEGENIVKAVRDAADGEGADAVVVVNSSARSYAQAPDFLAIGGTLVAVGIPGGSGPVTVEPAELVIRDIRIMGSAVGTRQDSVEALALAARGLVKPIVKVEDLSELTNIFKKMHKGDLVARMVVKVSQD